MEGNLPGGGGGTPYTFFRLHVYKWVGTSHAEVYKRVGISKAEEYKRVGKSVI